MRSAGQADCFVIVNGPEDGTEYPVVRTPFHIGADAGCEVRVRLDRAVEPIHALVTAVSGGYRIRNMERLPVLVNGKKATTIHSRIVRHGGLVQVGSTVFALDCAPDGIAQKSYGLVSGSDLSWAVQEGAKKLVTVTTYIVESLLGLVRRIFSSWLTIGLLFAGLYVFIPGFRYFIWSLFYRVYYAIMELL